MKDLADLIRIRQWYKNLVVFVAIIFSLNFFDYGKLLIATVAFFSLCLLSSANYVLNDIADKQRDRSHPYKRKRPLASGKITSAKAFCAFAALLIGGFSLAYTINAHYFFLSTVFLLMGMAYTFFLKSIFLADAITISVNFVFRAIAGAISISVIVSSWLIVCTFLLAMTLIFGKRKAELAVDNNQRIVLKFYTKEMLSGFSLVSIASLFISYSIYTISHSVYMPTTLPLAAFLLFRYMSFLYSEDRIIENAENLLRDRQLLFGSALWVFVVMIILYAL